MGANKTQAQGVALSLLAGVSIAAGLAGDINYLWVVVGVALVIAAAALFRKCKPWEHNEE